jgi:diguanylate cyclase (GGDEF)-like protein
MEGRAETVEPEMVRPVRTRSLRREWSRAFAVVLVLLLAASIATFAGVRQLVSDFRGTAHQIDREATIIASLRASLIDHEATAHQLLSGVPVDRQAFLRQQEQISRAFRDALGAFPPGKDTTGLLSQAARSWQAALTRATLWGDQVNALQGAHDELQADLGASSDEARSLLNSVNKPSLEAMRKALTTDAGLERRLLAALGALFGAALAVTVSFRRRMARDLVRPVATMYESLAKLQAGDYDHRIEVARRDELGELAEAFNRLAGALHAKHLALTRGATHDSVTGLPNRATLTERLSASFGAGSDRRARTESVLFIDIDDFKDINDSLGHDGGDELLVQLAGRLEGWVRPHDLVARLAADEFAIVVWEDDGGSAAVVVAERILEALRKPFTVSGTQLIVSVSIGVAQRRPETRDAADLLRDADFAVYMAKVGGKNRYRFFDAEMHETMVGRCALRADLAVAVTSDQLRLEYQPVADLRTGEIVGVEALVRWQHPILGLLSPGAFIGLAEETGDIDAIGCWVLDTATRQVAVWRETMHHCEEMWVSVNLSALQLPESDGLADIERILADPAAQADKVVLEVTETVLAADVDGGIASLTSLKRLGVRIAIDDFGTGFSSLSTLARLPVDILKIDRSFVSGQASTSPSVPMLEGIFGLADKLSLDVVAEGIEEFEQLDLLSTLGCQMGQGYLLGRPAPAHLLESLLASGGLLHVSASNASSYRLATLKSAPARSEESPASERSI